jgi:hypothetical protein
LVPHVEERARARRVERGEVAQHLKVVERVVECTVSFIAITIAG